MNLQIILSYSRATGQYVATAHPTEEAAEEMGASVHEAVDLECAALSSCLLTLFRRRTQARDVIQIVTFNPFACEEMERWGLLAEWCHSLNSCGVRLILQREIIAECGHSTKDGVCKICSEKAA